MARFSAREAEIKALTGMTLMFARSMGEFGATVILAGIVSTVLSFAVLLLGEAVNRNLERR